MPNVIEDMLTVVNTPAGPAVNVPTAAGIKVGPGITLADKLVGINDKLADLESRPAPVAATQTRLGLAKGSDTVIVDAEGGFHAVGVGTSVGAGGAFVGQWVFLRQNPLPPGYVALDGTLYTNAADKLPELLAYLATHEDECTTEADWKARSAAASGIGGVPYYVYDQTADYLRLPDTRSDTPYHGTAGTWQKDAIRNVTGEFGSTARGFYNDYGTVTGVFFTPQSGTGARPLMSNNVEAVSGLLFDSSRVVPTDTTNHPRRIGMTLAVYAGIIGA